jgi:hypothetical protein
MVGFLAPTSSLPHICIGARYPAVAQEEQHLDRNSFHHLLGVYREAACLEFKHHTDELSMGILV